MSETRLEPGLIRVFRWFAWLRLLSLAMIPLIGLRASFRQDFVFDITIPIIITVLNILMLLVFLYAPGLERKLGRYYFPVAIFIASAAILLEQYLLLNHSTYWLQYPFLFVLLILVAWQYRFRDVVFYSIGIAAAEIILGFISPGKSVFPVSAPEVQRMISVGLVFSRTIIFLVLGYVVTALMKAQREQRRALADAHQRLVQHASTLEQLTISRERNRMSRELHDTLAHTLSALTVQIEALLTVWQPIPEKPAQMLEQMLNTTRTGLDETRRSLSALRASPLEELGLGLAVRTMVEDFAARYEINVNLNINENLEDLTPDIEQCFYRVAQEALENVAVHAGAKQVKLELIHQSNGVILVVEDDGCGFDVHSDTIDYQGRFGVEGMYERAELIGAALTIDSGAGKGTRLRLYWENGQ
ncbi:MAG: sensor histidine kinase [Chloroflexota bacterium]|nr:sensor histidine kinase [Chloroflexota bacterium]